MTSDRAEVIQLLVAIATRYRAFGDPAVRGSQRWDGERYIRVEDLTQFPWDRGAGLWAAVLDTMAGMLEAQTGAISDQQRAYLRKRLFGGAGALHDYVLPEQLGARAVTANGEVERLRAKLFRLLSE